MLFNFRVEWNAPTKSSKKGTKCSNLPHKKIGNILQKKQMADICSSCGIQDHIVVP